MPLTARSLRTGGWSLKIILGVNGGKLNFKFQIISKFLF